LNTPFELNPVYLANKEFILRCRRGHWLDEGFAEAQHAESFRDPLLPQRVEDAAG
jgi:hypothetical protein